MKKLSIIVPVYNVERYLDKCIASLVDKVNEEIEVLLIDDGSKDRSGQMCDEYSKKYQWIKTYHKTNGGLSDARNYGIKKASGEYLMFVDSDDYLDEKFNIKELFKHMKYDIIQYKMIYYYEDTKKKLYLKDLQLNNQNNIIEQLKCKVEKDELSVSACNKIVKRSLIVDNDLYFEKNLISEDIDWSLNVYLHAQSMHTTNLEVYVYRQNRAGSITNTISSKRITSLYYILDKWVNYDYKNHEYKEIYYNYLAYQYLLLVSIINKNNCDSKLKNDIYKMKWITNYSQNYKVKKIAPFIQIFGIKFSSLILKSYLALKNRGICKL